MTLFSALHVRIHIAHSDHQAIARSMVWVALFVLLGSVARAAREMAIAYLYRGNAEVNAYLLLFNLMSRPVSVWISVLIVVQAPMAASIRQSESVDLLRFRTPARVL